jgi:hypothetical protein
LTAIFLEDSEIEDLRFLAEIPPSQDSRDFSLALADVNGGAAQGQGRNWFKRRGQRKG